MQDSCCKTLRLADIFKDKLKSQNSLYGLKSVHSHRYLHKQNSMHPCKDHLNHRRSCTFSIHIVRISLSESEMQKWPAVPMKTENNACFLLSSFI